MLKNLEGIRLQDDEKKLKYMPPSEEQEDELYFSNIPDPREDNICDQFEPMEDKMEIDYEGNKEVRL